MLRLDENTQVVWVLIWDNTIQPWIQTNLIRIAWLIPPSARKVIETWVLKYQAFGSCWNLPHGRIIWLVEVDGGIRDNPYIYLITHWWILFWWWSNIVGWTEEPIQERFQGCLSWKLLSWWSVGCSHLMSKLCPKSRWRRMPSCFWNVCKTNDSMMNHYIGMGTTKPH